MGGRLLPHFTISASPVRGFRIHEIGFILELHFLNPVTAMTSEKKRVYDSDIKINPEAVASVHEGGVVILDNSKGRLHSSGPAGAYIWRGIEQRLSPDAIAAKLHNDFQVGLTAAHEHTSRFLDQLQCNGLIERRAA
jgi:hypothetical protein